MRAIRQSTPKGIKKIGTMPRPVGTKAPLEIVDSRMTRIAKTEAITLPTKPKARYFSKADVGAGLDFDWDLL